MSLGATDIGNATIGGVYTSNPAALAAASAVLGDLDNPYAMANASIMSIGGSDRARATVAAMDAGFGVAAFGGQTPVDGTFASAVLASRPQDTGYTR